MALLVLLTEGVLLLRDIPVRAGEESQALVRMWPALTAAIGAFFIGLRLFKPRISAMQLLATRLRRHVTMPVIQQSSPGSD